MRTTRVMIDRHEFHISQGPALEDIQADVINAVRAGGGMVSFLAAGNNRVTALVSPSLAMFFENDPDSEESDDSVGTNTDLTHLFDDADY